MFANTNDYVRQGRGRIVSIKIAIIPDGARRWASSNGVSLELSYKLTFDILLEQLDYLVGSGVSEVHIYMLSKFNLDRVDHEIAACIDAELAFLRALSCRRWLKGLHGDLQAVEQRYPAAIALRELRSRTLSDADSISVHAYVGYSCEHEIAEKLRVLELSSTLDADAIARLLSQPKFDLLIRTGDSYTLSDFLPLQLRYAQLYFLVKLFNDLESGEVRALVERYLDSRPLFRRGL